MNVGVNYMREHMPSDARIHYAMIETGGSAPNVVQARARVRYSVRAATAPEMVKLVERVKKVAEGAALMTETKVEATILSAVSDLLGNTPLEQAMQIQLDRLGPPEFDEKDKEFARKIQATLSAEDIEAAYRRAGITDPSDSPMADLIVPMTHGKNGMKGSTDVGDVSWAVPTVQAHGATYAIGTPGHSWQLTAQGKEPAAHKGMVHVAKVMAGTALEAIQNEALIAAAKADLAKRTAKTPYVCPIPEGVAPPLQMSVGL